ncbi:MAG: tRNA (adenosine(37)-N6)-threonylcarbamoyltransferase complex transferase subunit TsaD [Chloroflexi bacterium]|nr:tRNA (adenosine(37)-N6)-threonylcarbamoyltransferase complex transferase subunit TsaD [Chloroflexota bacterium]
MNILGIESSCDETSAAVVADGTRILSNIVASQVEIHARYGGIVPEVASRQHLIAFVTTIQETLSQAQISWSELAAIAVTVGPGLVGSLLVGVNLAKAIALARHLPLIGINHLEGHIYAHWLEGNNPPAFPALCLIASGGHTELVVMRGHGQYQPLGRTRDDAAGEAFDKVARLLGLGYPGGPVIETAARTVTTVPITLPRAWLKGSDDFSFSGLKTAVLRLIQKAEPKAAILAASFQEAVVDVLVTKTVAAAKKHRVKEILLAGGVATNETLRRHMASHSPIPVRCPSPALCTDNAAMIAACGYFHLKAGQIAGWDLDVAPNLMLR